MRKINQCFKKSNVLSVCAQLTWRCLAQMKRSWCTKNEVYAGKIGTKGETSGGYRGAAATTNSEWGLCPAIFLIARIMVRQFWDLDKLDAPFLAPNFSTGIIHQKHNDCLEWHALKTLVVQGCLKHPLLLGNYGSCYPRRSTLVSPLPGTNTTGSHWEVHNLLGIFKIGPA